MKYEEIQKQNQRYPRILDVASNDTASNTSCSN